MNERMSKIKKSLVSSLKKQGFLVKSKDNLISFALGDDSEFQPDIVSIVFLEEELYLYFPVDGVVLNKQKMFNLVNFLNRDQICGKYVIDEDDEISYRSITFCYYSDDEFGFFLSSCLNEFGSSIRLIKHNKFFDAS